jgi:hypothetical protein
MFGIRLKLIEKIATAVLNATNNPGGKIIFLRKQPFPFSKKKVEKEIEIPLTDIIFVLAKMKKIIMG